MAIRFQFRRTRVARRMLALFVVCALLPIGIVAGISYQRLLNQLNGERAGQLAVTARLAAHTLEDRLSAAVAAVDRRLEGDPGTADWADAPVSDVVLIQPGGGVRSLLGGTGRPADRPDSFWEALAAAGAEPGIVVADEPPRLVSVVRPLDGGVVLAAHVDRSRLFAPLARPATWAPRSVWWIRTSRRSPAECHWSARRGNGWPVRWSMPPTPL